MSAKSPDDRNQIRDVFMINGIFLLLPELDGKNTHCKVRVTDLTETLKSGIVADM